MNKDTKKRIGYIDIARGIAIILIALGHTIIYSENCNLIIKLIYSFHVAMFFILSGYTFKIKRDQKFKDFIKSKFIRIMIPYFVWAMLFLIPYVLMGKLVGMSLGTNSTFNIKQLIINVLYGNGNASALKQNSSLWFLPALFSTQIINYNIIKFTGDNNIKKIFMCLFLLTISYMSCRFTKIVLPWGINTVINISGLLFYIGWLLKEHNDIVNKRVFKLKNILIILFIGVVSFYINNTVSYIDYKYGNILLALLSGILLSLFYIYIAFKIDKSKILEYIGKNTMGILIFHKLVILVFQTKLGTISEMLSGSNIFIELLLGILITAISIISSLLITEIIRRILPIIIGESRKIKVGD